jgi:chaperonin GroEL (HSP60 family)
VLFYFFTITVLETFVSNPSSFSSTNVFAQNPFFALSTKIADIYSDAIRQNMEKLTVSSAKIIQQQTIQAWTNAAQSCSKALAENAMSSQQQAIERITDANRKAFGIFGWDLSSFKLQPMTGFANGFATTTKYVSKSKRVK